jgi:hypothetical protein
MVRGVVGEKMRLASARSRAPRVEARNEQELRRLCGCCAFEKARRQALLARAMQMDRQGHKWLSAV